MLHLLLIGKKGSYSSLFTHVHITHDLQLVSFNFLPAFQRYKLKTLMNLTWNNYNKLSINKLSKFFSWMFITLFRSITMFVGLTIFYGIISMFKLSVENILWNIVNPTRLCDGSK